MTIVRLSWLGTAVFTLAAILGAAVGSAPLEGLSVGVDLVLFLVGCVVFILAYARAVPRSRTDEIAVAGLYLLMGGSAPKDVKRHLLGSLWTVIAVSLATAGARLYSPLAFGILVPMYPLGMCGLWAARNGSFPPRIVEPGRESRRRGAAR